MQDWWQQVAHTAVAEFSDIPDPAQATRIVMRLCLAALLGGLLGWEREATGKAAGVRTHMLVSMGSAMFVMIALQTGAQANEASRVMQGVIAGVGFLGAGSILKESRSAEGAPQVKGLTTAAGIWLPSAWRQACGKKPPPGSAPWWPTASCIWCPRWSAALKRGTPHAINASLE